MRKLIAIALLAVFGLPLIPSLLAMTPSRDADVPACCRGNGAHHCLRRSTQHNAAPTVLATCPYSAGSSAVAIAHAEPFVAPDRLQLSFHWNTTAPPAVHQQSRALSKPQHPQQQRGPPTRIL